MRVRSLVACVVSFVFASTLLAQPVTESELIASIRARLERPPANVVPRPETHECEIKNTSCNTTFTAVVNIFGCRTDSFFYYNVYRLRVNPNTSVTVSSSSISQRAFLVVFEELTLDTVGSDLKPVGVKATTTFTNTSSSARNYLVTIGPGDDLEDGSFNTTITCTTVNTGACTPSSTRLCLNGNRFAVSATWRTPSSSGNATAVSMTGDTGHFWFFNSANVELLVKVLDGRGVNGKWWVFFGALSDVEYTLTVTDTQTGTTRTYFNPQGRMASIGDTSAF